MYRIILLTIVFFWSPFLWSQSINHEKIEKQLTLADSLFSLNLYNDVIKLLTPLEATIQTQGDSNLKFDYYTLLSTSYLFNKDYTECVQTLDKGYVYNLSDLEDLICAANISIMELGKYEDTKKYARKALIKYFGNQYFEDNVSINSIGRLLYLLGLSYINNKDQFMATECQKIHSILNIEEQTDINLDLREHIKTLNTTTSSQKTNLSNQLIKIKNLSQSLKNQNLHKIDSIQILEKIESYNTITIENVNSYLKNILSLDSIYVLNKDIYSSKHLLDTAIQNINKAHVTLSSYYGIQLMIRLGQIYSLFKDEDNAKYWLFMAKNTCDNIGIHDNTYITLLQLIASIYTEKNIFWSRLFIEEAIEIFEDKYGSIFNQNKTEAYVLLTTYASILQESGQFDMAEKIHRYILEYSEDPMAIMFTLNNYGYMLSMTNRNYEAIYYYEQLNGLFPDASSITNLINAYINNGFFHNAESAFKQYLYSMFNTIINTYTVFTNYEIEKWWNTYAKELYGICNSFAGKINTPKSLKYGFEATIFCKTFPMLFNSIIKNYIKESDDIAVKKLMQDIKFYKDKLKRTRDIESEKVYLLHQQLQQSEELLKKNIPNFSQRIYDGRFTYKDISNALEDDEIAIEFFEYIDLLSHDSIKDSVPIHYAAYIVLPNTDAPIMIKMSPFIPLTDIIRSILFDEIQLNSTYANPDNLIYKNIWHKLIPYISDKRKVYYSTSGALSFINHEILRDNQGNMLCDKYNLYRVSSTSQIGRIKGSLSNNYVTATLFGNIDYDTPPEMMCEISNTSSNTNNLPSHLVLNHDDTRNGWSKLLYSAYEINSIKEILDSHKLNVHVLENNLANEETFLNLNGHSPDILHFATHGISWNNRSIPKNYKHISYSDYHKTMSFEGLLLSGCNNVWLNKVIPEFVEDGILSAEEILELDLTGTKLVVLSACETGRGSINLLGRVIGLQDAFKMAGTQSILMSLWKVPDESTALLMTKFYEALLNGHNRHEALKIARKKISEIYPDPYYWGAFVILD